MLLQNVIGANEASETGSAGFRAIARVNGGEGRQ
jgi:hypothetical protein